MSWSQLVQLQVMQFIEDLLINSYISMALFMQRRHQSTGVSTLILSNSVLTCTWGGIQPGWVKLTLPKENHCDVSWIVSTPSSPVLVSLHLLALRLKPSLSSLRAPEHPLFTSSLLVLFQVTQRGHRGSEFGRQRRADYTAIWTILWVRRCLIYYPALACRPFDTQHTSTYNRNCSTYSR